MTLFRTTREDSLWVLTIAPTIWAAHFLASYGTAAVWCAKFAASEGALNGARLAIAWYTAAAIAGICWVGWIGYRRHEHGTETTTHDLDTREDRRRFLGFVTLLLSCLSGIAVAFEAYAATMFTTCR